LRGNSAWLKAGRASDSSGPWLDFDGEVLAIRNGVLETGEFIR